MLRRTLFITALFVLLPACAQAQFGVPGATLVAERLTGDLLGEPAPEPGDQVGIFFGEQVVGRFVYTSDDTTRAFNMFVYGDDPSTEVKEGPEFNQILTVRFFDGSTDTVRTDLAFINANQEPITLRFKGQEVPPGLDDILPIDLTPTRGMNLQLGINPPGGNNGSGGDNAGNPAGNYDINADGTVDNKDAAVILRLIAGSITSRHLSATNTSTATTTTESDDTENGETTEATSAASSSVAALRTTPSGVLALELRLLEISSPATLMDRADVNNDGVVNSADAIEVLKNR